MEDTHEFAPGKFLTLGAVQERWQAVEAGVREYLAVTSWVAHALI